MAITGAAGGTGEKVTQTISVTEGQVISYAIGSGGAGGVISSSTLWSAGSDGGSSSFGSVTARGGGGAPQSTSYSQNNTATATSYTGGGSGGSAITVSGSTVSQAGNAGSDGWVKLTYNIVNPYAIYKVVHVTQGYATLKVYLDNVLLTNQSITVNGVSKNLSSGMLTLEGEFGKSATLTVAYNGKSENVAVEYKTDATTYAVYLTNITDGSVTLNGFVTGYQFTVPSGVTKLKIDGVTGYEEFEEDWTVSVQDTVSNVYWINEVFPAFEGGYSVTEIVEVTPKKTYTLDFNLDTEKNNLTISWGKDINNLTATVTDL